MRTKVNEPKREAVARVAYELYLRRGGEHGHDVEDWLTAEHLLQEKLKGRGKATRHPRVSRRLEDKRLF
jgi:hypothetical protein